MADLKNVIIDNEIYSGVKKISVRDTVSGRDLFLSEGFIEDSTQVQDIIANGQQTLVPSTGFDATKQIVVNINVPSSVGGDATAGDIRKNKTAWVNGVEVTGTIETYDGAYEGIVEDITSSVSAFNLSLKLNDRPTISMKSILGGGDGTFSASVVDADASASVATDILNVSSSATSDSTGVVRVTSGTKHLDIPINIEYELCLTGDTLITMFDGTQKRIDKIELGDRVLSVDENGDLVEGYVYYCDSHCNKVGNHYDRFVFEDGTELKIVHRHRFFNINEQRFIHLDLWYEGDEAYKQDGQSVSLTEKHIKDYEGEVPHYTLFCEHNTYFANGLLCGNRYSDKVKINSDISTYSMNVTSSEYMPILLKLPETFEGYKDIYIDNNSHDLILVDNNDNVINYYQIGYEDVYGAVYQNVNNDTDYSIDDIESNWDKICELPTNPGSNAVLGKKFDAVIIYINRVKRDNVVSLRSIPSPNITRQLEVFPSKTEGVAEIK